MYTFKNELNYYRIWQMGLLCSSKLESILMVKLQLLWEAIAEGDCQYVLLNVTSCPQLGISSIITP